MTTWRKEISDALDENNETWQDVVGNTLRNDQLDAEFDGGYGMPEGEPFTVWTSENVYFPWVYDGREGVACVPRNPNDSPTSHIGGW